MLSCSNCECHIHRWELRCPFCGLRRPLTFAPQVSQVSPISQLGVALAALGSLGLSACSDDVSGNSDGVTVTTQSSASQTTTSQTTTSETTGVMTTTTTSTDEGSSMDSNNQLFLPDTDISALYGVCDPFAQDCPEDEKCVPYASSGDGETFDSNKCVPIEGEGEPGEPCVYAGKVVATDDCNDDSFCWNTSEVDGAETGLCAAFCGGNPDGPDCPDGQICVVGFEGSLVACVPGCEPLAPNCPNEWGCHLNDNDYAFGCWLGEQAEGESCLASSYDIDDCAPGLYCAVADLLPMCDGDGCCTPFCDLDEPSCDHPGTQCAALFDGDPPVGFETLGICVVP